jgi:hypothetical protein
MKYKLNLTAKANVHVPAVTGAIVAPTSLFFAWLPSTWPAAPASMDEKFINTLKQIFEESILIEISNVLDDVHRANGSLQNRGHVLAIAMFSALDAIASYGYRGHRVKKFIEAHFPADYHPHSTQIYDLYRNSMIHSWNLFEASIYPDDSKVRPEGTTLAFGLLNFFNALVGATGDFLENLANSPALQGNTLRRYVELKRSARP